ncbi:hypothetical protein O6H91_10G041500 [Diphasiastrum complanatum]|uniref:Uncharacterized protein n=1 Tax=Diphasiastrum complanatum TaxID=34168 RepID=A0ACC2CG84_DIPCM|nr:hypothetical protein O6H91_10G041500 [Diphasiastrum complanatum]
MAAFLTSNANISSFLSTLNPTISSFAAAQLTALLPSTVQLQDYACTEKQRPSVAHNYFEPETDLPVIDLASLRSINGSERDKSIKELVRAGKEWGFFRLVNHGLPLPLITGLENQMHKAFALPLEMKERAVSFPNAPWGYVCTARSASVHKPLWQEGITLPLDPHTRKEVVNKLWNDDKEQCKRELSAYINSVQRIARELLEALAVGIGIESEVLSKYLVSGNSSSMLRLNCYPPCPDPSSILGLGAHSDPDLLTILHQDDVGGLQIYRDDRWMGVRPQVGTFVVNIGDVLQILSNGIYTSCNHRVMLNRERPRKSIAFFVVPQPALTVSPLPQLVDTDHPQLYKTFIYSDYVASYRSHKLDGKSNIEKFRLQN